MNSRYHIPTEPAPAPFTYPAKFRLGEGDEYVKYGHRALRPGRRGGDPYWTPQIITQTWYQAETGRIPISGAGYGGAFAGSGFDSIWLDMSEIVRPMTWAESCRPWSLTLQVTWPVGCHLSWRSLCRFFSIPCLCPRQDGERNWLWSGLRLALAPLPSWSQRTGARTSCPLPHTLPPACLQFLLTAH